MQLQLLCWQRFWLDVFYPVVYMAYRSSTRVAAADYATMNGRCDEVMTAALQLASAARQHSYGVCLHWVTLCSQVGWLLVGRWV